MAGSVVTCECKHVFQDSVYGPQRRYAIRVADKGNKDRFVLRCTVCLRIHKEEAASERKGAKK